MHTRAHTQTHTYKKIHTYIHTNTHRPIIISTYIHTYADTHTHKCIHSHKHTLTPSLSTLTGPHTRCLELHTDIISFYTLSQSQNLHSGAEGPPSRRCSQGCQRTHRPITINSHGYTKWGCPCPEWCSSTTTTTSSSSRSSSTTTTNSSSRSSSSGSSSGWTRPAATAAAAAAGAAATARACIEQSSGCHSLRGRRQGDQSTRDALLLYEV